MGVYIKGKRKPDTCYDCDFVDGSDDCFFGLGYTGDMCDCVYEDCPLIEVKTPHGRLIDAGKWHKRLQKQAMTLYESDHRTYGLIMDIMDAIHTEPTVIEAEVE